MGKRRSCSVLGCHSTAGLHGFPEDLEFRRRWLRAIGLGEDSELPVRAGVCDLHFSRDSFSNFCEVNLGFAKRLRLTAEAVPTLGLVQPRPPSPMEVGPAAPIQQPVSVPPSPVLTSRHPGGAAAPIQQPVPLLSLVVAARPTGGALRRLEVSA